MNSPVTRYLIALLLAGMGILGIVAVNNNLNQGNVRGNNQGNFFGANST